MFDSVLNTPLTYFHIFKPNQEAYGILPPNINTAQKNKNSIKDFFSKCDQIRSLLRKSSIENFIFCAVQNI